MCLNQLSLFSTNISYFISSIVRKVLSKLFGFNLDNETIRHISGCRPWAIEKTLMFLHTKIDRKVFGQKKTGSQTKPRNTHRADVNSDSPDVDQCKLHCVSEDVKAKF